MQWTADCTRALQQVKVRGDKKPLKSLKKRQVIGFWKCEGRKVRKLIYNKNS